MQPHKAFHMRLRQALLNVIADLATPGVGSPYMRGVIGSAHALVGAAMMSFLGVAGVAWAVCLGAAYWLIKESGDVRRGGASRDGIEDALFVCMGALYGHPGWPVAVLLTAFGVMVLAEMRR